MSGAIVFVLLLPAIVTLGLLGLVSIWVFYGARNFAHQGGDKPPPPSATEDDSPRDEVPIGFEKTMVLGWKGVEIPAIVSSNWKKKNPTLVFLHGFFDTMSVWTTVMQELNETSSQELNMVSLTLRGTHERSIPKDNDLSIYACAQDVLNFIITDERFSPNSVIHLAGHGLGDLVAQMAVRQAPGVFSSHVSICFPHVRNFWRFLTTKYVGQVLPHLWLPVLLRLPWLPEYWLRGDHRAFLQWYSSLFPVSSSLDTKSASTSSGTRSRSSSKSSKRSSRRSSRRSSQSSRRSSQSSRSSSQSSSSQTFPRAHPLASGTTFLLQGGRGSGSSWSRSQVQLYVETMQDLKVLEGRLALVRQSIAATVMPGVVQSWFGELVFGHSVKLGSMLTEATDKIAVRTLKVYGKEDRLVPPVVVDAFTRNGDFSTGKIRKVQFSSCGHWPHLEVTKDFCGTIDAWTNVSFSGIGGSA